MFSIRGTDAVRYMSVPAGVRRHIVRTAKDAVAKSPDLRKPAGGPSTQTLPASVNQRRAHRRRSHARLTSIVQGF